MNLEAVEITLLVIGALEQIEVPYVVGGSFASAVHGIMRSTLDADLVAQIKDEHIIPLVAELQGQFYIDEEMIRSAILYQSSFNVIHLETGFKVDIFIYKARGFAESQFQRRERQVIATDPDREAFISSAEDTILAKLDWYRLGNEVSSRQWDDVLGIIKLQGERLDLAYLRKWAVELGVADLLERALE